MLLYKISLVLQTRSRHYFSSTGVLNTHRERRHIFQSKPLARKNNIHKTKTKIHKRTANSSVLKGFILGIKLPIK